MVSIVNGSLMGPSFAPVACTATSAFAAVEHLYQTSTPPARLRADERRPAEPPRGRRDRPRRARRGRVAAPADARRIHRPARGQGEPRRAPPGGEGEGRGGGPRPAVRPARPGQDDPRDDHRPRARRERPLHERAGGRAGGGPRGDPHRARRARRAVHRRDPPPQPRGRGDPLPGDGGLRARRDDRQGAERAQPAPQPQAVHGRRRDHPRGPDQRAAARPVRDDLPARLLRRGRPHGDRPALGGDPGRRGRRRRRAPDREARPGHAADRQPAAPPGPRPRRGASATGRSTWTR